MMLLDVGAFSTVETSIQAMAGAWPWPGHRRPTAPKSAAVGGDHNQITNHPSEKPPFQQPPTSWLSAPWLVEHALVEHALVHHGIIFRRFTRLISIIGEHT